MLSAKRFHSKIVDEYGGEYPNALVCVRWADEIKSDAIELNEATDVYSEKVQTMSLQYRLSYWYSSTTKAENRRSRPLYHEDGAGFSDLFEVDLNNPAVISVLNGNLEGNERKLEAIKADVIKRFS